MNRRLSDQWLVTQNRVLAQFSANLPLPEVLDSLARGAEHQLPGARCLVTVAEGSGRSLRVAAAPRLPELLRDDVPALVVGENALPCGVAAARQEAVLVHDMLDDPAWVNHRPFAEALHVRACWSTPMFGVQGEVVGTFAVIYAEPRTPRDDERQVIDTCTHLAAMMIQRHRHEQALRESEQRFRAAADAAPVLIWMTGLDKKCIYVSKPWLDFTGRTLEQELGDGWLDGVHPDDRAGCLETYTRAFDRRAPFKMEYRLRRYDGAYRWMLDHGVARHAPDGTFLGYIGTCVDITDRREAEQTQRERALRLRLALEAARIGTWRWDIATGTVEWSENLAQIHSQDPSTLTGRFDDFVGHVDPAHRDRVLGELSRALDERGTYETEYRTRDSDGEPRWLAGRGEVIVDDEGQPVAMTGVCMDVTERREAEEQLRAHARQQATVAQLGQRALSGENLQTLMDEMVRRVSTTLEAPLTKVLELAPDGRSLSLRAGVGWRKGLVGQGSVGAGLDSQAGYTLQSDEPVVVKDLAREQRFNGPPLLVEHGVVSGMSVIIPGLGGRPWGVFGVHTRERRDFTADDINFLQSVAHLLAVAIQRKTNERELQTLSETLERRVADRTAVAEHRASQLRALAAELAQAERRERRRLSKLLHDHLQQLLVAAKLRVDAMASHLDDTELIQRAEQVDELLEQAIDASRSLTVELSPPILYDAGLPAAIEWLCRWMHDKHGLMVKLNMNVAESQKPLASETCVFLFDAVRELLFNVVKHAKVHEAEVRVTHRPPGALRIEVIDHGAGFDAATRQESDVTTAGFGLFSIQQRVQLFGGRMDTHTSPGDGTRVTLELDTADASANASADGAETAVSPVADRPATPATARVGDGGAMVLPCLKQNNGNLGNGDAEPTSPAIRVLVVDDHGPLRKGLITLLAGQRDIQVVGEAMDGEMAIEAAQRLRPDVVLMDVHMPGLNGIEATRRVREAAPTSRVVGLSIEEHEEMARVMREAGASAYLPKGSPPAELFAAIRDHAPLPREATG